MGTAGLSTGYLGRCDTQDASHVLRQVRHRRGYHALIAGTHVTRVHEANEATQEPEGRHREILDLGADPSDAAEAREHLQAVGADGHI